MYNEKMFFALGSIMLICILTLAFIQPVLATSESNDTYEILKFHELIVEKDLVTLNENGQMVINKDINSLEVNENLINEYIDSINILNFGVEKGIIYYDKNYKPQSLNKQQIIDQLKEKANDSTEYYPLNITPYTIDTGLEKLYVTSIVRSNRQELENVYDSLLESSKWTGANPYSGTVGHFVGKVMEGGDWDYKVKSGYSPWYHEFQMYFFDGWDVQNSSYLGNYNYGYVGEFLFSENVLLMGGDGVSILTKKEIDGNEDKIPISRGFNDAVKYD